MNFLQRLFGQSDKSNTAQDAKERLKTALAQDRAELAPETLDVLRNAIIDAVSKHMEIDKEHVQVSIAREGQAHNLAVNIPVVNTRPPRRRTTNGTRRTIRTIRTVNTK